jgi:hypothetical protein
MAEPLRHRQTKEAATDMFSLQQPRHISTLHNATLGNVRFSAGYEGKADISRQRISAPTGKRTVKTEPLPASLATVTSPPIMRASLREIARPSPVPP